MSERHRAVEARIAALGRGVVGAWQIVAEIWAGYRRRDPLLYRAGCVGCALGLCIVFGLDFEILSRLGRLSLYPPDGVAWHVYAITCVWGPTLAFGLAQRGKKKTFSRQLKECFDIVGLRNAIGGYPNFISLEPLSGGTQLLRLTSGGFTGQEWRAKRQALGANLRVFIDEIRDVTDRGIVELTFSFDPMPDRVSVGNVRGYRGYTFLIGRDRTRSYIGNFAESPHLLVAGESGGGKSSFLRQMIVTIKVNQPEAEIHLVDLKEGVDIAPLAVCPGMYAYLNVQATANMLRNVLGDIQRRLALLKTRGMNDIGLFFASDEFKKMSEAERAAHDLGRRLFVVVDECAELMLFSPGKDGAVTRETRGALSKIARLGRAAGVHLILGTQRPDKSAVDPQVKSNLTTIVCFRLNDIGGSLAVLGTGRANDLPKIKGRVILQHGSDEIEVQTPYLDFMAGLAELKPPDTANKKKISPTESLILLSEDSDGKTTPKA